MILRKRRRRLVSIAPLVLFALSITTSAGAQSAKATARYSATTTGLSAGASTDIRVDILRWSSDDEASKLVAAFKDMKNQWTSVLEQSTTVGYVWVSTSALGYSVKLARQISLPDGGSRIALVVLPTLGNWERPAWKSATQATDYPFTVIELRVNKAGQGEGKASLAGNIGVDEAAKTVGLENYATAPILLKGVMRGGTAP